MHTITRLKAADRHGVRTTIELDGEEWGTFDTEVVLRHELSPGRTLDEQECERLLREDAFVRARRVAALLLAIRPRSSQELRRRLRDYRPRARRRRSRRNVSFAADESAPPAPPFDEATIEAVVAHFTETGDLDDARFARRFVRHHLKLRAVGRLKLRNQLLQLGVAENVIDAALAAEPVARPEGEAATIRRFIKRRLPRLQRDKPERRRQKLDASLLRAGFDPEVFRPLLKEALGASVFSRDSSEDRGTDEDT
jgi:SOS response regulatory protein OraA/RecX